VIALDYLSRVLAENSGADTLKHLRESHTSIDAVGAIAEEAGVATLVLSHFVPDDDSISDEEWTARAQKGFSGSVISGRDAMVL
jgi:ribonuclease BN (tRNA processing enzyme)